MGILGKSRKDKANRLREPVGGCAKEAGDRPGKAWENLLGGGCRGVGQLVKLSGQAADFPGSGPVVDIMVGRGLVKAHGGLTEAFLNNGLILGLRSQCLSFLAQGLQLGFDGNPGFMSFIGFTRIFRGRNSVGHGLHHLSLKKSYVENYVSMYMKKMQPKFAKLPAPWYTLTQE